MADLSMRLKAAMKAIESVYKKYDLGGVATVSEGLGEVNYKMFIDTPSFSTIDFVKDDSAVHIKMHLKSDRENVERTVNMLVNTKNVIGHMFLNLSEMEELIEQTVKIEKGPGKNYPS